MNSEQWMHHNRKEMDRLQKFSYPDPGTKKIEVVAGIGSGEPLPTMDRSLLFQEVGTTGLTRFGGLVYEEFLRELQGPNGIALLREMRENHPIVSAVFFAIEMALRQVRWHMEPVSSGDTEISDFIEGCREDMSFTWNDIVAQILTMLQYGFSIFEIVYKIRKGSDADPESRYSDGKIGWRKWLPIAQDTLAPGRNWIFDPFGGVQGIHQMAPPDWQLRTIPIEKMLLFRTTVSKNNPEGRSIMRGMYTSWYYSKNLQEIEGIAAERMGTGLPVMYMGEDTAKSGTQSDLALAQQIVRDTRADEQMGVVIPYPKMGQGAEPGKGMLFELVAPPSRGMVDFDAVISRYDKRIAVAVLAQFLMLGSDSTGSFALAKSHSDLFALAMESWGEMIAAVFNRYAVPRLLKLNGIKAKGDDLPHLAHSEVEVGNLTEIAEYVNKLVGANVLTPDENLEAALREKARLPKKQESIDVRGQQAVDVGEGLADEIKKGAERVPKPMGTNPNPVPFPSSQKNRAERFQDPLERRAYGGAKYETANNDYQETLQKIYELFWAGIIGALLAAENQPERMVILSTATSELQTDLIRAGRKGLREAFDLGLGGEAASPQGLAQLQKRIQANEDFISQSLIPAIKIKAEAAMLEESVLLGGEEGLGGVFQSMRGRVGSYAGNHWVSIWDGLGDQLGQDPDGADRRIERVLDPAADHCDDCIEFAHIYDNWQEMLMVAGIPGDGGTQCYSNCRCILKVETAPGVFERLSVLQKVEKFEEEEHWVTINGQHILMKRGYELSPLKYGGSDFNMRMVIAGNKDSLGEGTIQKVSVDRIYSTQRTVKTSAVEDLLGNSDIEKGRPIGHAYQYKGKIHLDDGNHHVAAAIKGGARTVPLTVINLDRVSYHASSPELVVEEFMEEQRYPVDPRIWEAEKLISSGKGEQHYGLSSGGEVVTFPRGRVEPDQIALTQSEQENLKGGIYTHNHPADKNYAELSAEDYTLAHDLSLQMIRVVGAGGDVALAIRPPTGWPPTWGEFLAEPRYLEYHLKE